MGREREGERRGREGVTRLNDKKRTKRHAVGHRTRSRQTQRPMTRGVKPQSNPMCIVLTGEVSPLLGCCLRCLVAFFFSFSLFLCCVFVVPLSCPVVLSLRQLVVSTGRVATPLHSTKPNQPTNQPNTTSKKQHQDKEKKENETNPKRIPPNASVCRVVSCRAYLCVGCFLLGSCGTRQSGLRTETKEERTRTRDGAARCGWCWVWVVRSVYVLVGVVVVCLSFWLLSFVLCCVSFVSPLCSLLVPLSSRVGAAQRRSQRQSKY